MPTRGLKRLALGMVAAVAVLGGAVAAMPLLVHPEAVREAVQAEIRYATGFEPVLRGDVSVSAFPSGSASFFDISLSDDAQGPPALAAERLTAQLRLLPLLLGRIEVGEITLIRPKILVDVDAEGHSNWSGLLSRLSRTLRPEDRQDRPVSFSEILMVDGTVTVRNRGQGRSETLRAVDLSLAWPSISRRFGATGHFIWRGEKVEASVNVNDFLAALTGERSGVKLRMSAAPLNLAFDGHFATAPALKVDGTLAADSASLRSALVWAGQTPLPGNGLKRFALKAKTSVVGDTIALSSVNVELDGNAAEGVLTLTGDARPVLQGTLAAEQIDITPYISGVRLFAGEQHWNRSPITLEGLASLEFDLRISASRILFGNTQVGRTAIGTSLRNGRFALTIGESRAFGGILKGSIGLTRGDIGADLKAQLDFTDVDLEPCLAALFGVRRLEGHGNVRLSLDASGADIEHLARAVNGVGHLTASRGALTGLNIEQALRRLERRPLSGVGDFRNGRTPFETLAINLKLAKGVATVQSMTLEGSSVRLAVGGSASIPRRDLDLQGVATLVSAPAKDGAPFELPFAVRGNWDDPVMTPDIQSLIRRSGAAAPLLEAVRNGRSREAVRSAIEQLTRGNEAAAPVDPAAAEATVAPSQ